MISPRRRRARPGTLWPLLLLLLVPQAACEGDLAIDTGSSTQSQNNPPPDLGDPTPPPMILPDQDAGVFYDAAVPAPPTPPDNPPPTCVPFCEDRGCGADGCGGVCGTCQTGWACNEQFQCVPPEPEGPDVTLYGADWCGYCQQAKRFFQDHDVEFTDRDLDEPGVREEAADRVYELTGSRGVSTPTIIIDEHVIHGWSEGEVRSYLDL